jgi:hypothetical protein
VSEPLDPVPSATLPAERHYPVETAMTGFIGKLLVLAAVLIMPLSMQSAAGAMHRDTRTATQPMEHCPKPWRGDNPTSFVECTLACSATLPAVDLPQVEPLAIAGTPTVAAPERALQGLHPDIETPPPKAS